MKKKILSLVLALGALSTMAFATPKNLTLGCGDQAQITATPETGYHFVKWSDESTDAIRIIIPTQDSNLIAYFAINEYTIIFNNWNDTLLEKQTLNHGAIVTYTGATPTKTGDAQYTYTFQGWNPTISSPASADATYTAEYSQTIKQYDISFLNWDSTVLQSSKWDYGSTPVYSGSNPTKPSTAQYNYTFKGWDKTIASVTGNAEYLAQFDSTTISYQISVIPNDVNFGTTTGGGTYAYGTSITITATANDCYKFVKWDDGDTNATRDVEVTGVKTYTAIFEKIKYTISVDSESDTKGKVDITKIP